MKEYKIYVIKLGNYILTGSLYMNDHVYIITDEQNNKHYFPLGKTVIEEV